MKHLFYTLALAALVLLPSCKKETWVDWRIENQLWLKQVIADKGLTPTPTGLCVQELQAGIPTQPHPDDLKTVCVNYTGSLINGNVFDKGENILLEVSNVIPGFAEGLKKMTSGSHCILYIPYDIAYGTDGKGAEGSVGYIPPYSTLIFDVTLISVY
ncbi:MAG: FKBP-type peptidyl-prolyl cis-trans isomerase [Paludibacteraceae bacterium]|nr:FKBP-type peptidyl-prolyl cis-trans isomerase [Paludibacteraceae bacterium]